MSKPFRWKRRHVVRSPGALLPASNWFRVKAFCNSQACNNAIQVLAWAVAAGTFWFAFLPDSKVRESEKLVAAAKLAELQANASADAARMDLRTTRLETAETRRRLAQVRDELDRVTSDVKSVQLKHKVTSAELDESRATRLQLASDVERLQVENQAAVDSLAVARYSAASFRHRFRTQTLSSIRIYVAATCVPQFPLPNLAACAMEGVKREGYFSTLSVRDQRQLQASLLEHGTSLQTEFHTLWTMTQQKMDRLLEDQKLRCAPQAVGPRPRDCAGDPEGMAQVRTLRGYGYVSELIDKRMGMVVDDVLRKSRCPTPPEVGRLPSDWPLDC